MAVTNQFPPEAIRRIRQGANLGKIGRDGPVDPFPKSRKVIWRDEKTSEPLGWILLRVGERATAATRQATAVPSGERTPADEPRPQPQPRLGPADSLSFQHALAPQLKPSLRRSGEASNNRKVEIGDRSARRRLVRRRSASRSGSSEGCVGRSEACVLFPGASGARVVGFLTGEHERLKERFRKRQEELGFRAKDIRANMGSLAQRLTPPRREEPRS
jgi:hypothetical protein